MEPFWLLVALGSLTAGLWEYFQNAWEGQAAVLFGISGLAFVWYSTRRMLRKKIEANQDKD